MRIFRLGLNAVCVDGGISVSPGVGPAPGRYAAISPVESIGQQISVRIGTGGVEAVT